MLSRCFSVGLTVDMTVQKCTLSFHVRCFPCHKPSRKSPFFILFFLWFEYDTGCISMEVFHALSVEHVHIYPNKIKMGIYGRVYGMETYGTVSFSTAVCSTQVEGRGMSSKYWPRQGPNRGLPNLGPASSHATSQRA